MDGPAGWGRCTCLSRPPSFKVLACLPLNLGCVCCPAERLSRRCHLPARRAHSHCGSCRERGGGLALPGPWLRFRAVIEKLASLGHAVLGTCLELPATSAVSHLLDYVYNEPQLRPLAASWPECVLGGRPVKLDTPSFVVMIGVIRSSVWHRAWHRATT